MKIDAKLIHNLDFVTKEAGKIIRKYYDQDITVEEKSDKSPVTIADIEANKLISKCLKERYPNFGLLTEELDKEWEECTWTVDPLDGTYEFVNGIPEFVIMIGFLEGDASIFGYIRNPITDEVYFGGPDVPATYIDSSGKESELQIRKNKVVKENIICVTTKSKEGRARKHFGKLGVRFSRFTKTGSEGLRFMRIAEQKANLRIDERGNTFGVWDICAPHAILEAAGGAVRTFDGEKLTYPRGLSRLQKGFIAADNPERIQNLPWIN